VGKYREYIRFGHGRSDLTLLYANPKILKNAISDLIAPFVDKGITKVMAIDAQGFALGALAADHLKAGLVFVRKGGKIAWKTKTIEIMDYSRTQKTLEIAEGILSKADKVLVIDDWSETGAQLRGAIDLAEKCGAKVVGAAAVNIDDKVLQDARLSKYILHDIEHFTH
jgi:adenine phosphoribosyltransferase